MKPKREANIALAITRSKAKMYEYNLPEEQHLKITYSLDNLLDLTIGMLGDISAGCDIEVNSEDDLIFSAKYFDALLNTKTEDESSDYLKILGSTAYYLAGYAGSAMVLANNISETDLEANKLDKIILGLIKKEKINCEIISNDNVYKEVLDIFIENLNEYYLMGKNGDKIISLADNIRNLAYRCGSDRELLMGDIIYSLSCKVTELSAWNLLPKYSKIDVNLWEPYLQRSDAVKELWPAQVLLCKEGVFNKKSAIIQMPTSAGKTRSAELIIRSVFLRDQTELAIIVAPYRALCNEIYNDMNLRFKADNNVNIGIVSDVMRFDIIDDEEGFFIKSKKQVLILTPEKLEYLLRHEPEISKSIGLIIYDEGHLFDDSSRGTKYELLLTSLKQMLSEETQVVLISAVIPNAEQIGKWLIGESCSIIQASHISPTQKNIAFVSWKDIRGMLSFSNPLNLEQQEFYVPKVLESQELKLRQRETKKRYYPEEKDGAFEPAHIAMALGCRLVSSGPVAIFVGRKDSAALILRDIIEAYDRGLEIQKPIKYVEESEFNKVLLFIQDVLGEDSIQAKAAELGILVHHGSTPYGVRLAVEYALQKQHSKFVVCTSTLSQGVNLPIRYLIVTTDRQGKETIKIRDFHNLMGRAGRAGKYTEGTIIFSDHQIIDFRNNYYKKWRWRNAIRMLNPQNSEQCKSNILQLLDTEPEEEIARKKWRKNNKLIKSDIKSYLLNRFEDVKSIDDVEGKIKDLVENTLAFYQSNNYEKKALYEEFLSIGKEVFLKEPDSERRKILSRAFIDMDDSLEILNYLDNIAIDVLNEYKINNLIELTWPIIHKYSSNLPSSIHSDKLLEIMKLWVSGSKYPEILSNLKDERFSNRKPTMDHVVDLCENKFGFEGSLLIGSIIELLQLVDDLEEYNIDHIEVLQKLIKYGLPNMFAVNLYEIGFSDRNLSMMIAGLLGNRCKGDSKKLILNCLKRYKKQVNEILDNYPEYFKNILANLTH